MENNSSIAKEDAIIILNRIIDFVKICDTKASIIIGIYGFIITLSFSSGGVTNLKAIIIKALKGVTPGTGLYLFLLGVSLIIFFIGVSKLIAVLNARLDCSAYEQSDLNLTSLMYFHNIAKHNTYNDYKNKVLNATNDEFFNDILSQIYLNSKICTEKYENYNKGLILSIKGAIAFVILWAIGNFSL